MTDTTRRDAAHLLQMVQKNGETTRTNLAAASMMFGDQFNDALRYAVDLGYLAEADGRISAPEVQF